MQTVSIQLPLCCYWSAGNNRYSVIYRNHLCINLCVSGCNDTQPTDNHVIYLLLEQQYTLQDTTLINICMALSGSAK